MTNLKCICFIFSRVKNKLKSPNNFLDLDEDGNGIMAIIRDWTGKDVPKVSPGATIFRSRIESCLPAENVIHLEVDYRTDGIDTDNDTHDNYLNKFRRFVLERLQNLVNASIEIDPEIKSRKKMVQEVYAESMAHLSLLREIKPAEDDDGSIARIKKLLISG